MIFHGRLFLFLLKAYLFNALSSWYWLLHSFIWPFALHTFFCFYRHWWKSHASSLPRKQIQSALLTFWICSKLSFPSSGKPFQCILAFTSLLTCILILALTHCTVHFQWIIAFLEHLSSSGCAQCALDYHQQHAIISSQMHSFNVLLSKWVMFH